MIEALARRRAGQHRHPQAGGGRSGDRRRRHPGQRRVGLAPPGRGRRGPAVGWVAMHMHGDPRTMQHAPDVRRRGRRGRAPSWSAGPRPPGTRACDESGSTPASASARRLRTTWPFCGISTSSSPPGYPVVLGTSRKRFLGVLAGRLRRPRRRAAGAGRRPARGLGRDRGLGDGARRSRWFGCTMCGQRCTPPQSSPAEQDRSAACRA